MRHLYFFNFFLLYITANTLTKSSTLQEALSFTESIHRQKRAVETNNQHTLELIIVVDKAMYELLDENDQEVQEKISSLYTGLKNNYNVLSTTVVLLKYFILKTDEEMYDPVTLKDCNESDEKPPRKCVDATELLTNFNTWRKKKYQDSKSLGSTEARAWQNHDTAHLLSGYEFIGSTVGLAYLKTVCHRDNDAAGVNQFHKNDQFLASIVTHELGHNLGLEHDNEECVCTTGASSCVMAPTLSQTGTNQWSECSVSKFGILSNDPCINNDPDPDIFWDEPDCGDGIVTGEEECDCGPSGNSCNIECCDSSTCKLKSGKQCDKGLCCDEKCMFRPLAYQCRPQDNICDQTEVCTGTHGFCPIDVFSRKEEKCINSLNGQNGYCQDGKCQNGDDQCKEIYGENAYHDLSCYNDDWPKCQFLLCKGNYDKENPILSDKTIETFNNGCFKHKKTDDFLPYNVNDGTSCGNDKLCKYRQCYEWQDPKMDPLKQCPGTTDKNGENFLECNNQGTCNSEGNCHCNCGYAPPYCLHRGEGGSVDSATICPSTFKTIIIIFAILLVVIFIAFIFIIRWYLKRYNYDVSFKGFMDLLGVIDDQKPKVKENIYAPENSNKKLENRTVPEPTNPAEQFRPTNRWDDHEPTNNQSSNITNNFNTPSAGPTGPPLPNRDYGRQSLSPQLPNRDYPR